MIVMGFDPGLETAFAVLEAEPRGRFAWLKHGSFGAEILEVLPDLLNNARPDLVAIETPAGFIHDKYRGPTVLEAAVLAGELGGRAHMLGFAVAKASAAEWRRALCGLHVCKDPDVKRMVLVRARLVPARTCNHDRDAAGVAMFCALRAGRRR